MVFIRSPYNYDTELVSIESSISEFGESKTQQQFKEQCDINRIIRDYARGVVPIGSPREPLPADQFYPLTNFQEAQNKVRKGLEAFATVPSNIRAQFNNDPGAFIDFVSNPANLSKVAEMGLAATGKPLPPGLGEAPQSPQAPSSEGVAQ